MFFLRNSRFGNKILPVITPIRPAGVVRTIAAAPRHGGSRARCVRMRRENWGYRLPGRAVFLRPTFTLSLTESRRG